MAKHRDVVVTDWMSQCEQRVASFVPNGSLACQIFDPAYAHLEGMEVVRQDGRVVRPEDGDLYLDALAETLSSTYVAVLPLHSDEDCPFQSGNVIHLRHSATA